MHAVGTDGATSRDAARALLRRAVELGVRVIDTADVYGDGDSEQLIAEALAPYRTDIVIATKGGLVRTQRGERPERDGRPRQIRRACEASLQRLGVDVIDLYQLHAPDPKVPLADTVGAMVELRDAGKIRHIGLSNVNRAQLAEALAITPVASMQNRYNHVDRSAEHVVDTCAELGIAFFPWAPIQVASSTAVRAVADRYGTTVSAVALAWLLARSPVIVPIPGTSSIAHLEDNMAAGDLLLDADDLALLAPPG